MEILAFFNQNLAVIDRAVSTLIQKEISRQKNNIELIASENIVSKAVLEAQGSVLTNKYAEGYPGKRYYGGCEYVDAIEEIAIERAKKLFHAQYVNVQPHSGTQANQAVFFALLQPFDKFLGLSLDCGGHLTHGSKVNQSGKWFEAVHYGVNKDTNLIDMNEVRELALAHKPKLIIAGCSAYSRFIDFAAFRSIANEIGCYLMVDMAHFAGLVAAGCYDNPVNHAHVVTTTTHKTLRGPRGGMILTNDSDIAKKVQSSVFPGSQGGPLMHVIAAKAVAFHEALSENYRDYIKQVVLNAQIMCKILIERGYEIVTGGTDCHLLLINLQKQKISGRDAQINLDKVGMACNKNSIPFDNTKPTITSGIRIGTPAGTTRGFKEKEFSIIAHLVADVLDELHDNSKNRISINNEMQSLSVSFAKEQEVKSKVLELCNKFPIYSDLD